MDTPNPLCAELTLLEPDHLRLYLDEFEDLVLEMDGEPRTVRPIRAFPLTAADEFIVLKDEEGEEIGTVRRLSDLDPSSRGVLASELEKAYFTPEILQLNEIVETYHIPKGDVETDREPRIFEIRSQRRDIRTLNNGRVLVRDSDGNRCEIPDYRRLDPVSRALVEGYI